jgi:hypothetical protein
MYRESLPEDCPPEGSEEIHGSLVVYRLVRNNPPTDCDFRSQQAERPNRTFTGIECIARGLSVHTDRTQSVQVRNGLPRLKGLLICRVVLSYGAGRIQRTFRHPSHHTWWPLNEFDILAHCSVEE